MKKQKSRMSAEDSSKFLETMLRIRLFDEKQYDLVKLGKFPVYYSCFGREPIASAVCLNLRHDDMIATTHHGFSHVIAKGIDLQGMFAEIFGKSTGLCRGKGGIFHLTETKVGILGEYPIVGADIPISVGAGLASRLSKTGRVTACFFGDGSANTSVFHEGLNVASVLGLPVLFICENDGFGELQKTMKVKDIATRAIAYGMRGMVLDGTNAAEVYRTTASLVKEVRDKSEPVLVEVRIPPLERELRETNSYEEMIEKQGRRDHLLKFTEELIKDGILTARQVSAVRSRVKQEIEKAAGAAEAQPEPLPNQALSGVSS